MNDEEAKALVAKWAADWRVYLNGPLHFKARDALVAAVTAALDAKAPRRGRPPKSPDDVRVPQDEKAE